MPKADPAKSSKCHIHIPGPCIHPQVVTRCHNYPTPAINVGENLADANNSAQISRSLVPSNECSLCCEWQCRCEWLVETTAALGTHHSLQPLVYHSLPIFTNQKGNLVYEPESKTNTNLHKAAEPQPSPLHRFLALLRIKLIESKVTRACAVAYCAYIAPGSRSGARQLSGLWGRKGYTYIAHR